MFRSHINKYENDKDKNDMNQSNNYLCDLQNEFKKCFGIKGDITVERIKNFLKFLKNNCKIYDFTNIENIPKKITKNNKYIVFEQIITLIKDYIKFDLDTTVQYNMSIYNNHNNHLQNLYDSIVNDSMEIVDDYGYDL